MRGVLPRFSRKSLKNKRAHTSGSWIRSGDPKHTANKANDIKGKVEKSLTRLRLYQQQKRAPPPQNKQQLKDTIISSWKIIIGSL